MEWSDDPELMKIFIAETAERSARLVATANALASHTDPALLRAAVRDAHTLKGNFAMLGYDRLSGAAATLEQAWNEVLSGRVAPSNGWRTELAALAAALLPALEHGESTIGPACRSVCEKLGQPCPVAGDPGIGNGTGVRNETFYGLATDRPDLDGLIERARGLMLGDAIGVDAANLYELINRSVEVRLDTEALVGELLAEVGDGPWRPAAESLVAGVAQLQEDATRLASGPIGEITRTLAQLVRYVANRTGKSVSLRIVGEDVPVDRQLLDVLREPLRHLVVNAVDHGVETPVEREAMGKPMVAEVRIEFVVDGSTLRVIVSDDGRGVDWGAVEMAARAAGFVPMDGRPHDRASLEHLLLTEKVSTGGSGDGFSGDGAGLSIVSELVEGVHGGMRIDSIAGKGTSVSVSLPSSLALQDILVVGAAGMRWGVPRAAVIAMVPYRSTDLVVDGWDLGYDHDGERLPFLSLCSLLGGVPAEPTEEVVVVATRAGPLALGVPEVLSNRLVAVKRLGGVLAGTDFLAGAALLGGGDIVVVVEPAGLGSVSRVPAGVERPLVVVVDDSRAVRQLVAATLVSQGLDVVAVPDRAGLKEALVKRTPSAVVLDYHLDGDDGASLAASLAHHHPDVPVVLLSGVADDDEQEAARAAGVRAIFRKSTLGDGSFADELLKVVMAGRPDSTEVAV